MSKRKVTVKIDPRVIAKQDIVDAIESMPDEAFGYLAVAAQGSNVWPDNTGGFNEASQASIREVREAVARYLEPTQS